MNDFDLAAIGLFLGLIGTLLILFFVVPVQLYIVFQRNRDDWLKRYFLLVAKISYLVFALPVVALSLYNAVTNPSDDATRNLLRFGFGITLFINGISWMIIYYGGKLWPPTHD